MDNIKIGDKVIMELGVTGTVERVSTWLEVNGEPSEDAPCYFVRVPEWDNGTNGGRWIDAGNVKLAE